MTKKVKKLPIPLAPAIPVFEKQKIDEDGALRTYVPPWQTNVLDGVRGELLCIAFRYGDWVYNASMRVIPMPSFCGGYICHYGRRGVNTYHAPSTGPALPDYKPMIDAAGVKTSTVQEASIAAGILAMMVRSTKTSSGANGRDDCFHHTVWNEILHHPQFRPYTNMVMVNASPVVSDDRNMSAQETGRPKDLTDPLFSRGTGMTDVFRPSEGATRVEFGRFLPVPEINTTEPFRNMNSDNACWWTVWNYLDEQAQMYDEGDVQFWWECEDCGYEWQDYEDTDECPDCGWHGVFRQGDDDEAEGIMAQYSNMFRPGDAVPEEYINIAKETVAVLRRPENFLKGWWLSIFDH